MVNRDSLLRENPLFFRFWFSRLISVVGSTSTRIAIPLEVLKLTESASLAALVTTVALAPILILGIPAGAFADHSSRVFIMRVAELASAITTATLAAILLLLGFCRLHCSYRLHYCQYLPSFSMHVALGFFPILCLKNV